MAMLPKKKYAIIITPSISYREKSSQYFKVLFKWVPREVALYLHPVWNSQCQFHVLLAGLLVSVFLLFSGFVIYPSNIPAYWKWLVYLNPIHWANVSFCRIQFNKGYTDPCSKYLGELHFCDQFPSMTVGNAYMVFYELSQDAKIPWLPYVILLGWIGIANLLTVLGLKKIEFTGTSQSLPQLKKTHIIKKYEEDRETKFQSYNSNSKHLISLHEGMKDNGGVEKWIEEFQVDLERQGLGIPVKQVTLLFEDLSFTRFVLYS